MQFAHVAGFRRLSPRYSLFVSTFMSTLYMFDSTHICLIVDISVVLEVFHISLLEDYHHLRVVPRCGYSSF